MAKKKKNLFKRLMDDVKKAGQGIAKGLHKIGKNLVEMEEMVVLAPFKGAMKHQLDKKGIKHSNKLKDIAPKFVKHIVKGSNFENYQGDLKHYEDYESLENLETLEQYERYWANGEVPNFDNLGEEEGAKLATDVASSIINAVVDFFKTLLKKKKDGVPMTDAENKMADLAEKGAEKANELIQQEATKSVGGFVMDNKIIIIIAVVVLGYFAFLRKK